MVSNASEQIFPDNTRSSFTKFLADQLNLERQWEVASSEKTNPSMYKNVTQGKFTFFDKSFKFVRILPSGTWFSPFHYEYCWSHEHSQSRKTQSQRNCITVEVSRRTKKKTITLQMKDLVLLFSVQIWDIFSEVMLAMNLEYCWEEKDLTNQNLLRTLSAYTLIWFTWTWLITISLVTRRLHCCVAFFLFRSSRLETLYLLGSTWTIRHSETGNSDRCSKVLFIVITLASESRAVKKYPLFLLVSLVLVWCSGKPLTFISDLKTAQDGSFKKSRDSML